MKLHLDFETRSRADLTKVGAWAYASDPSTDIICMGVALGDAEPLVIKNAGMKTGIHLHEAAPGGWQSEFDQIVAHNVQFEYAIYHFILHKRYDWPEMLDPTRWDCTMARGYMCGLPGSLEGLALALRLPFQKDLIGRQALMKICKPRKDGTFNEDPALYEAVYAYNGLDIKTERAADKALPELPPEERKIFELDLKINRRGLMLDLGVAKRATEASVGLTDALNARLRSMTGGACSKASGVPEMKRWIAAQGVPIPVVTKVDKDTGEEVDKETLDIEAVKDLVKDPKTPKHVVDVLKIRQQVGKSSVAKFKKMLECACADGRARGMFQYHGAHTGRWAARHFQPANMPQGYQGEGHEIEASQDFALQTLEMGWEVFGGVFGDKAMQTLSDITRAAIVPAAGKIFVGADLNAIECRVLNWLAGEQWVTDLFARGESPYIRMAEEIFGRKGLSKKGNPFEYDIGKRSELGFGFGMGAAKFQGSVYTETSKRGEGVWLDDELVETAKNAYRSTHQEVMRFWYGTESAAVLAMQNPGKLYKSGYSGRIAWAMSNDRRFLCCRLPSGRLLRYYAPSVVNAFSTRCKDPKCEHVAKDDVQFCPKKKMRTELRYWTAAGEGAIRTACNGFMGEYRTWGGELVENVVQAVARDFMVVGLARAEERGAFPIVLHNYDELLAEVNNFGPDHNWSLELATLIKLMTENLPAWTAGCPVKAEGFIGRRYRK